MPRKDNLRISIGRRTTAHSQLWKMTRIVVTKASFLHSRPPKHSPADQPGRTVLPELFTGSGCPPCTGADLAVDAETAFKSPLSEVVGKMPRNAFH